MGGRIEKAVFGGTKETGREIKAAGREKCGVEGRKIDEARREKARAREREREKMQEHS